MKSRQKKNASMNHLAVNRRITRSMSLADGRENSLPIPIDIIIIILSKLNSKSIARCRCVSKLWALLLRRSDFTKLFFSMSCSRGPNLLFAFRNGNKVFFSSPHPQNPAKNLSRIVINYQMQFSTDSRSYFENSDLVNGLLCIIDLRILNGKDELMMIICNPSTGQTILLPEVNMNTNSYCLWSLLGYDPIGKQFKVLAMTKRGKDDEMWDEYQVLTLGSGNMSWKMIECSISHNCPWKTICINGVLYYTSVNLNAKTCEIVCFDIRFEKFTFINVVGTLKEVVLDGITSMINYNDKLGLLQTYGDDLSHGFPDGINITFKLWILEDVEKQEWSYRTFLFSNLPENIVGIELLRFAGVTENKEIVVWSKYPKYPFYVLYLNLEKNSVAKVVIEGMDEEEVDTVLLDHVENVNLYASV